MPGLTLTVTTRRAFWALSYQPHGTNPATGKRWGGGVRHELGDAMLVSVSEAKTLALTAKSLVRQGRSPHHEAMAARATAVEERSNLPKSVNEALDAYAAALAARRQPSETARRVIVYYTRKAIRLMQAENLALSTLDQRAIRLMIETMPGSDGERCLVFNNLKRFLSWCVKQELIEHNHCDKFDRDERPKRGRPRDHVPTIDEIKAVWNAAENEPQRDLIRFLLLTPMRRNGSQRTSNGPKSTSNEAAFCIDANRMKKREAHELPLSLAALAIPETRRPGRTRRVRFSNQPQAGNTKAGVPSPLASASASAPTRPPRPGGLASTISAVPLSRTWQNSVSTSTCWTNV